MIGTSGSGKSSVARQIAHRSQLPYIEMDACYWKSDWVPSDPQSFRQQVREICAGNAWVLDGNYSGITQDIKWQRCELVVWVDRSFVRTTYQVVKRTLQRTLSGTELWAGNRETIRNSFFARDAVVWWSVKTWRRNRRKYATLMADPAQPSFVRLTTDAEIEHFLNKLGKSRQVTRHMHPDSPPG